VELTAAIAAYNMVCHFLKALDGAEINGEKLEDPEILHPES
jgi:hypothetical protein